jgi:prepilin-type processing-associated H-X9-DG protein
MADYPSPPPVPHAAPAKTSAMAVTSLVLGILGLFTCGTTALFGLPLGIISLVKIKNNKETLKGDGMALAGIITSAVFLLMIPIFAAMLLPALAAAKQRAQTINCVVNEKQLALAALIYAGDHTNQFPPSASWCDAILPNVGSNNRVFQCPTAANPADKCDYAFNAALGGMDTGKVNPRTVLIFESDGGWNASGGSELMVSRHMGGKVCVVAYADGSVQEIRQSALNTLRWNP